MRLPNFRLTKPGIKDWRKDENKTALGDGSCKHNRMKVSDNGKNSFHLIGDTEWFRCRLNRLRCIGIAKTFFFQDQSFAVGDVMKATICHGLYSITKLN